MLSGFPASRNLPRLPRLFRFCGFGEPDLEFCTSGRVPAQRYVPPFTPVISLSSASTQDFDPRLGAATSSVPQPARGHGGHLEPKQSAARSAPTVGVGHRPGPPTMPLGSSAYPPRE